MPDINMQIFEEAKRNQLVTEVDIQTQVALDNYQVQLSDIANPTQSQDNVVIDRYGEFLPHWNESLDFDTWVKMSMELAGKRILMLHGNSSVSSASNADNVFIQYHGVSTATYHDANVLDSTSNFIWESYAKNLDSDFIRQGVADTANIGSGDGFSIYRVTTSVYINSFDNGITTYDGEAYTINIGTYYRWKQTFDGTTYRGYVDENEIVNGVTSGFPDANVGLFMSENEVDEGNGQQDWSRIRKYTATEPTLQISTPKNILTVLKLFGRAG